MGQGNFTAIIYGVRVDSQEATDHPVIEKWYLHGIREDENNGLTIKTSYESEDPWIGFMVGDNDGNINTRYEPNATDGNHYPQKGLLFYRRALNLLTILDEVKAADPEHYRAVETAWPLFAAEMAAEGIVLPDPQLLLIDDWS